LESRDGALWLRVNLGNGGHVYTSVKTAHPQREALLQRAYASLPYNVTLRLEDGKVYAHFTWSEEVPPPVHTEANGVLGVDVNGDPYHLALAVASPDGNLVRYLTLSLEEVDRAPNKGPRNSSSGRSPTGWWPWPRNTGSPSPRKGSSTSVSPGKAMAPAGRSGRSSTASPIDRS
jgi:hypothetical protein